MLKMQPPFLRQTLLASSRPWSASRGPHRLRSRPFLP